MKRLGIDYYSSFSKLSISSANMEYFRVYNVGQGLLNLFGNVENQAIFDFGSFTYEYEYMKFRLKDVNFDSVKSIFISHAHADHYNLIDIGDFINLNTMVFPLNSVLGSKMLSILVSAFKKGVKLICVPDTKTMGELVYSKRMSNGIMNLHFGKPMPLNFNSNGILLYFEMDNEIINKFFTGDVYFEVVNSVLKYYPNVCENLCCPHHGGDVGKTKLVNLRGLISVLSYYPGFYRNIPNRFTVNELNIAGYELKHTVCIPVGHYYNI